MATEEFVMWPANLLISHDVTAESPQNQDPTYSIYSWAYPSCI